MANTKFNAKNGISVGGVNGSTPVDVVDSLGNLTTASLTIPATGFVVALTGLYENSANITANYTIAAGNNALSSGPITVASGITVTIPSGSVWSIV